VYYDLTTNGVIVMDSLKNVQNKLDHLNDTEKRLLEDIKRSREPEEEEEEEEQETTR